VHANCCERSLTGLSTKSGQHQMISSTSVTITRTSTASLSTISELPGKAASGMRRATPALRLLHWAGVRRVFALARRRDEWEHFEKCLVVYVHAVGEQIVGCDIEVGAIWGN